MAQKSFSHFSDEELARLSRENIDAFAEIVDRFETPLLRYILRISQFSQEEAREMLQEVFVKAWENLRGFDDSQKFSSWIYRIAHNQTISEYRKQKSRGAEKRIQWDDELLRNLPDAIDLPRNMNRKLDAKSIHSVLLLLPEKYKTALVLRFLEEKSYDEISDILHIPLGTAATLVNRAKKLFAQRAEENCISFSPEK